jgi:hypothetical protein
VIACAHLLLALSFHRHHPEFNQFLQIRCLPVIRNFLGVPNELVTLFYQIWYTTGKMVKLVVQPMDHAGYTCILKAPTHKQANTI